MAYRDELFEYLRKSELYQVASQDIDKIISYMSVRIQEGSLAYMFGFKTVQNSYEDELPWLAGNPSWILNPTIEEAVARIKDMRESYELYIMKFMKIIDYGVEKYLQENMDMIDRYYVLLDTRDKIVDQYIERKPETLEEMNRLACSDLGFRFINSAWHEAYEKNFRLYFLREQIGFDRAQFNVDILSVDVNKLMDARERLKGRNYYELPRIIVEYVDPDDETDLPLVLPMCNNKFKKIEITLSHNVAFLFQRNNSPLENNGRRKNDIYLLKTTVAPSTGHEVLGNIGNYNYDEMGLVIQKAVMDLYELTGIEVNPATIRLNDVELNLTFRQNCDFNELMRSVSYYQNYIRKGYVTKEFKVQDEGIVHFCTDMTDCKTVDLYKKKKRRIEHKYSKMKTTGFTTSSQSVIVKLYDKKEETIAYANSQGYDLKIEGDEAIIRLEFRIRNRDQLKRYFYVKEDDESVYFWNLSQEKIEETYKNLVDIFFKKTYEEGYFPESINALIGIVSALDTTEKGGKWKQKLKDDILSQEIWNKATPALLSEKDITNVIQHNHTFARKPKKYKRILWDLLKESETYKKGQEHAYDMLYNFLNKTYSRNTLSTKRRVGYAVSDYREKLPDMEKEIEQILYRRYQWEKLQNMGQEDFDEADQIADNSP